MSKSRWIYRKKDILKEYFLKIWEDNTRVAVLNKPNIFEEKYYKFIVTIFRAVQLWPYPDPKQSLVMKLLIIILYYTLSATIIIPQIVWAVEDDCDVYDFILSYSLVLFHVISMSKYTAILQNRLMVKTLFDEIQNSWQSITSENDRELLADYTNLGYFYRNVYIVTSSAGWFVINAVQYLPIVAETFFDIKNDANLRVFQNPGNYLVDLGKAGDIIRCFHFTVTTLLNLCIIASIDIFFLMCAAHISGLFNILSYKLNQCGSKLNYRDRSTSSIDYNYLLKELRQLVIFHSEILKNVARLESTLSFSSLIVEIICLSMLPMTLFICYNGFKYPILTGQAAMFFVAFTLELFLLNVVGQRIIDQSGMICNSTFCSDWYNLPTEYQRFLTLIMVRSLHPSKLTAGKLSTLSLSAFVTILKTIFSYYAVLVSVL